MDISKEELKQRKLIIVIISNITFLFFKLCCKFIIYINLYIVIVFFHLCYEGAVDLDTIRDINDRHGLEVQIMEFGQIPKQVFTLPHPKRLIPIVDTLQTATLTVSRMTDTSEPFINLIIF